MYRPRRHLALLDVTLELSAEEREAFVHANSRDPVLREQVLASAEVADRLDDFLERPAWVEMARAGIL